MTEKTYRHMMEQVALSDRKKEEILTMLENQNTQKRRMPKAGTMILAAALAVGLMLSIAAGLPAQVYNFVAGGSVTVLPGSNEVDYRLSNEDQAPILLEDGRLWLEADGKKVDITDRVDEDTPYIYTRTDPATGEKGYVVAGGTVDNFGWAEFYLTGEGVGSMVGENFADNSIILSDGRELSFFGLPEGEAAQIMEGDDFVDLKCVNRPWLDAALAQLELE